MTSTGFRRIGLADTIDRGTGIMIPRSGTGGGGEYGADITNELRTFAVTREPVAYRIVFTVAHDVFDNWFELELEGDEGTEKSQQFDKNIQTLLANLNAKEELNRMTVFERAYGWAILVLGYEDGAANLSEPVAEGTIKGPREIKAYGPTQIDNVKEVKRRDDARYGLPEMYYIKRPGLTTPLKVHYSRVIHFATRLLEHDWKGKSVLDPVWDDLTTLRNIMWGMGQTMYRYGSGFPDITFTGAEKSDIEDWIDSGAFENLSARTFFAHSENQTIDFKGLQGRALDPMNYYLPPMERISCGTGIPLAIIRGVQAGALTGSEVNQMEYYGLISDEQSGYERGIRTLINILLGEQKEAPDYKFNWLGGFELDEHKQAEIELIQAQKLQILGQWHTRNELRKMENPDAPDLPADQGGEEILGKAQPFQQKEQGIGTPENVVQEQLKQGDSFLVTRVNKRR